MAARALAVGLMAAVALLTLAVDPVAAHARLVSATPAAGATLTSAPRAVRLEFDEPPYDIGVGVVVSSPTGATVTRGRARVDGNAVVVSLASLTEAGTYTVAWRIVSTDGHPVSGEYTFTYGPESAGAASAPAGSSTGGDNHGWVLLAVAVLAVVGLSVLLVMPRRRHGPAPKEHQLP